MSNVKCRFCGSPTKKETVCPECKCITTDSIPEDVSSNSKFTDYSYNNYSSKLLNFIFQSWNKFQTALLFKDDFISKLIKLFLSPITTLNPLVNVPKKGKIIDIGCGRGDFLKHLPNEMDYRGVDIVDYGLKDPKIVVLNFETQSIDEQFDIARSIHSVEHAQKPKVFLNKISQVTDKGGILILATPNSKFWLRKYFGEDWVTLKVKTHYCILNPDSIEKELKSLGFQVLDSSTYTLFSHIESIGRKFNLKNNFFSFALFVLLLYPLGVLEKIFGVADSIIIYAKKN